MPSPKPLPYRIQEDATFRQKRLLPGRLVGELNTPSGQRTSMIQIVAKATLPSGVQEIPAAKILGIRASALEEALQVSVGDTVRSNSLLAQSKTRFGSEKLVQAPSDGTVLDIIDGTIYISGRPKEAVVRALLQGWIVGKTPNRGVTIEAKGTQIEGLWNNGHEGHGMLQLLTDQPNGVPLVERVMSESQGAIIALGVLESAQLVLDAEERGVRGFVAGSVADAVLQRLDEFTVPIFVTDGAGKHGMMPAIFELLGRAHGQEISILSKETCDSARPLLYIPSEGGPTPRQTGALQSGTRMTLGTRVRLKCDPYIGAIGTVVTIRSEPSYGHIISDIQIADVRLEDGRVVGMRLNNLDIIM